MIEVETPLNFIIVAKEWRATYVVRFSLIPTAFAISFKSALTVYKI
jgi:hypothetical protein